MYSFFTVNFLFLGCLFLRVARWGGALIGGVARWGGALFGGVARWGGVLFGGVAHLIGGCGEVALLIDMSEIDDAPEKVRCILPSSSEEALFSCALNCCNNCSLAYKQKHTQGAIVKLLLFYHEYSHHEFSYVLFSFLFRVHYLHTRANCSDQHEMNKRSNPG